LLTLLDAAIDARAKHVRRNRRDFERLHGFMPQNPRLPIQRHVRDIGNRNSRFVETVLDREIRKAAVMFDAPKSALLRPAATIGPSKSKTPPASPESRLSLICVDNLKFTSLRSRNMPANFNRLEGVHAENVASA
jgi:hypothetical protein